MYMLTRSYNLSASHSLIGHPKCSRMHGHNYEIEVVIGVEKLNSDSMIIDFGDLKLVLEEVLGPYDHMHLGEIPEGWTANPDHVIELPFKDSTAENLSKFWGAQIKKRISPLKLVQINVFESPRSKASWIPEE